MKYPAEHYTRAECLAIMNACGDSWTGKRNRALIVVMWRSGLRLAEALAVKTWDINLDEKTIRIRHGQGDKARTVGFDKKTVEELQAWIIARGSPLHEKDYLICTRVGDPLKQSYVRSLLPRLARKAGITKRVHAHGFRHTFAVELARERVPAVHIQRLLGHSSLATTSVYLASLSPEETLDSVRERKW